MAWAAGGSIPSGARGGFRTVVKTISTMIDMGLKKITPGHEALVQGHESARGITDTNQNRPNDPNVPGNGTYISAQAQTLPGTDIRNFSRSSALTSAKVKT